MGFHHRFILNYFSKVNNTKWSNGLCLKQREWLKQIKAGLSSLVKAFFLKNFNTASAFPFGFHAMWLFISVLQNVASSKPMSEHKLVQYSRVHPFLWTGVKNCAASTFRSRTDVFRLTLPRILYSTFFKNSSPQIALKCLELEPFPCRSGCSEARLFNGEGIRT